MIGIHRLIIGILIIAVAGLSSCKYGKEESGGRLVFSNACSYLWKQQGKDGAWHSETHSLLKGGQALTPFVLWSLLEVPDSIFPKNAYQVNKGLNYLRNQLDTHGVLGFADPDIIEYPNYANAYALMVLSRYGDHTDNMRINHLQRYLLAQQFTEDRGIYPSEWIYGGWGFGEKDLPRAQSGQVDISHTRRVIQALYISGYPIDSLSASTGLFLGLLQKNPRDPRLQPGVGTEVSTVPFDGGFYYSPVVWGANKGQQDNLGYFRSYPTATCDGYLALNLLGDTQDSKKKALNYLQNHPSLFTWGHIDNTTSNTWSTAMQYYHLMVRSEVYHAVNLDGPWSKDIENWILQVQLPNGSFVNPKGAISKEDDPLMSTAMVVITLLKCLQADNYALSKRN